MSVPFSFEKIEQAYQVNKGKVLRTPLIFSPFFSKQTGAEVYLKLENLQKTGSFKARGASYKIETQIDKIGPGGVVAASAGNHAQGVALAARQSGLPATIVMPEWASLSKQEATRAYGGEVVLRGKSMAEAIHEATELVGDGKTLIHPFDDFDIMAGQGTIGIEIFEDLEDADAIVVPVGGGGLVAGIAEAAKTIRPKTAIIGVQATACPSLSQSLELGRPAQVNQNPTIADGIAVPRPGERPFEVLRNKMDDAVLVDEEQIASAVVTLLEHKKLLAEGAGAVPIAALLSRLFPLTKGRKIVLVISGGNVDLPLLDRILGKGLMATGRLMKVSVTVDDSPGALACLLTTVARLQANVYRVGHRRSEEDVSILKSRVDLELETRGWEHRKRITEALKREGYLT